jgi:hypothetical protein
MFSQNASATAPAIRLFFLQFRRAQVSTAIVTTPYASKLSSDQEAAAYKGPIWQ